MVFGYPVEPDFDLAKEERQSRVGMVFLGGIALWVIYLFSGLPFAVQVFQVWFATSLCYGASVYVRRRNDLNKSWLWKGVLASVPLHVVYLAIVFWSDRAIPSLMTKALGFIPILALGFAIESILVDWILDRFEPSREEQIGEPATRM